MISTTLLIALPLLGATVHALPNPLAARKADQGIVIPITKSPQYLAKRAGEAVDLSWLSGSREDVRLSVLFALYLPISSPVPARLTRA